MDIVPTQIPIATNDWLKLELSEVLEWALSRQDVTALKTIKKVPAAKDVLFAPFCMLYGLEPTKLAKMSSVEAGTKLASSWHASALRLLSLPNFLNMHASFDRDCLDENMVLEVFESLNREELRLEKVYAFNAALGNLVRWCQGTVAYHIITHPYKVRNPKTVPPGSELAEFARRIDVLMGRFYAFKAFLLKANKISKKTNFAFNLKHSKPAKKVPPPTLP